MHNDYFENHLHANYVQGFQQGVRNSSAWVCGQIYMMIQMFYIFEKKVFSQVFSLFFSKNANLLTLMFFQGLYEFILWNTKGEKHQ